MKLYIQIVNNVSTSVCEIVWDRVYEHVKHITCSNVLIFSSKHVSIPVRKSTFANVTLTINKHIKKYEFKK